MISHLGESRKEVIDLVKAAMSSGQEYGDERVEKRSWWGRIKNRLFE